MFTGGRGLEEQGLKDMRGAKRTSGHLLTPKCGRPGSHDLGGLQARGVVFRAHRGKAKDRDLFPGCRAAPGGLVEGFEMWTE